MLSEKELEAAIEVILGRLDEVNTIYIEKVAAQIKTIGELSPSSINRLIVMAEMGADIREINSKLASATDLNIRDLYKIYNAAMQEVYTDKRLQHLLDVVPADATEPAQEVLPEARQNPAQIQKAAITTPEAATERETETTPEQRRETEIKQRLTHYTRAVAMQTANQMRNLSNTTAASQRYAEAVDKAVLAVTSGVTDYTSATREIIRDIGYNGLMVEYESGHRRRLDSAVKQNIISGANQIAQNGAKIMGDELKTDAYELSAHMNSAHDHEPVQGRVFLRLEFDKMQTGQDFQGVDGKHYSGFRRPIAEWNCGHIAMPFHTEYSIRTYKDADLDAWAENNNAGCKINGKHYTTYQASQLMRSIETEVRRQKDTANAARTAGDEQLRRDCQIKIDKLSKWYGEVAKTAGLPTKRQRMRVEGFRMVRIDYEQKNA